MREIVRICWHGKSVSGALSTKKHYKTVTLPPNRTSSADIFNTVFRLFICSPRFIFLLYEWAKWMTYLLLTINFPAVQQERLFVHENVFHAERNMSWNDPDPISDHIRVGKGQQ